MLRIAIPNKGTLSSPAAQMLREAGYRQRSSDRDLTCVDSANDVEFFYLRPRDIATYVGSGDLALGITGRDLLIDADSGATEIMDLDFAGSTMRFAAVPGSVEPPAGLAGHRVATSFPGVVQRHLLDLGVKADVIADVVETGATLRQVGLVTVGEPILRSSAVLVGRADNGDLPGVTQLVRRLQGVLVARQYVMIAYDVPTARLDDAVALTPGIESPTISPLHREGWVAVNAMVLRGEVHRIMDELYEVGARAILVTDIHACRL